MPKKRKETRKKKNKKEKGTSIGCLIWIALILLIIVLVLFNKDSILNYFKSIENKEKERIEITETTPHKTVVPLEESSPKKETHKPITESTIDKLRPKIEKEIRDELKSEIEKELKDQLEKIKKEEEKQSPPKTDAKIKPQTTQEKPPLPPATNLKTRKFNVFFVLPPEEGPLEIIGTPREIAFENSPLTATLNDLLTGVTPAELQKTPDLISTIPAKSKIKSINIKDGIAYIDLNRAFTINPFSKEGLECSIKQIVLTATEFPTVKAVQILIEGKKQEFLGAEGGYIGIPLNRESF